jgi:hypothetical protein
MLTMRRLQAPAGHEPGIDQHQDRAFCPAICETSTYAQMCAAAQPLCGRVETVWVQPQSFDDGRQPESRSSQLTGGPQSIDWGNRVVHMDLRFADSTARAWFTGIDGHPNHACISATRANQREYRTILEMTRGRSDDAIGSTVSRRISVFRMLMSFFPQSFHQSFAEMEFQCT